MATIEIDPLLTPEIVAEINRRVRGVRLGSYDQWEIASRLTRGDKRAVRRWFAPPGASQYRALLPREVAGKRLSDLPGGYALRAEIGLLLSGRAAEGIEAREKGEVAALGLSQIPAAGREPKTWTQIVSTLSQALDRAREVRSGAGIEPYVSRHWHHLSISQHWREDEGEWEYHIDTVLDDLPEEDGKDTP